MIYYIADNHFGHKNVIRFDNRPFADTVLMDEVLVHPCPCFDGHNDRTFKPGFFKYFALQPIGE